MPKAIDSLQSHSTSNPCSFSQKGAIAALKGDQTAVEDMRDEFSVRRDYMFDRLSKMPNITAVKPLGAFYTLVNIGKLGAELDEFQRPSAEQGERRRGAGDRVWR